MKIKYAVELFIDNYFNSNTNFNIDKIYNKFKQLYPNIEIGSFRMKIQNIVQICIEKKLISRYFVPISPLSSYSQQCLNAFNNLFSEYENMTNYVIKNNLQFKVYSLIVDDSYGEEIISVYISDTPKDIESLMISPKTKLAMALRDKVVGDVFNIDTSKYKVEDIEEIPE